MAIGGMFLLGPGPAAVIEWPRQRRWSTLVDHSLLPFTSIFIEPAKVLFLNNAINHGVLTPLGHRPGRSSTGSRCCSCSRPTPARASAC